MLILLSLLIIFILIILSYYYYIFIKSPDTGAAYNFADQSIPQPIPQPIPRPIPQPEKTRLATIDGKDFLCPLGYYFEGDSTQQACVKEGVDGYVCPLNWAKVNGKPYCQYSPDTTGHDNATSSATGGGQPPPPITTTPVVTTPITTTPVVTTSVDKIGPCPFGGCDKFDNAGNCIAYSDGGYHCAMTDIRPFTYNNTKYFGTNNAIVNNATFSKMCSTTQKDGRYVCKFAKGNTFGPDLISMGKGNLNIYPEDIQQTGVSSTQLNTLPTPWSTVVSTTTGNVTLNTRKIRKVYIQGPPWREGILWDDEIAAKLPSGWTSGGQAMDVYEVSEASKDIINPYNVYMSLFNNTNGVFRLIKYAEINKGIIGNKAVLPVGFTQYAIFAVKKNVIIGCAGKNTSPYLRQVIKLDSTQPDCTGNGWLQDFTIN